MAEQDIYGGKLANNSPSLPKGTFTGSSAEQDIYANKLAGHAPSLPHGAFTGSGAEQDIYGTKFADHSLPRPSSFAGSGAEQDIYGSKFAGHSLPRASFGASSAEQDVYGSHFSRTAYQGLGTSALGLLHSAILPSFSLHAGLSAVAYGVSRYTDRVEGKDVLWASGMTLNAWWSAIGSKYVYDNVAPIDAWNGLGYSQKLLLAGVTAWGVRLTSRVVSRSLKRGKDDPRYDVKRKDPGFWNKALFTTFLPEAVAQTIISLPFTIPFRAVAESAVASPFTSNGFVFHSLAIFLFTTGFALETLADFQLETFKKDDSAQGINREGVWSIVRHPNYLGDALIHASFPILLLGAGILHPITALGPIANYVFLRYIGGDRENEESQAERYSKHDAIKAQEYEEYRQQKNSFWPKLEEFRNNWTLGVLGVGIAGVILERGFRTMV
ncbi:related to DUF1295 domain protein [Fusarium fujikuroi IMI 58289]|uniref:Related to DUF1295 domain protein n=1 Tax=Gibberella fujikuroi (strain CBS 195.34 / IMI 58289 / NRRL A-6831) TaxID=1279085 RepID=S0ELG3_GIBF5|nr:uncharacterized protein FFUJ_10095 [Fusarium fujikuroi IMI 58289]KLP19841.1 DUF1295 domain protein [Fusarium fujikuroi]CCT73223.1 related to DUF1295 domain protein [Fusarium fujikuroi IMI 58289]SCO16359.1 related to DUF1295 domain protein [Fusarium fujikuroi]SCO56498.1 related to DUF1295 domain protein [Fusarium fujikuroi]